MEYCFLYLKCEKTPHGFSLTLEEIFKGIFFTSLLKHLFGIQPPPPLNKIKKTRGKSLKKKTT